MRAAKLIKTGRTMTNNNNVFSAININDQINMINRLTNVFGSVLMEKFCTKLVQNLRGNRAYPLLNAAVTALAQIAKVVKDDFENGLPVAHHNFEKVAYDQVVYAVRSGESKVKISYNDVGTLEVEFEKKNFSYSKYLWLINDGHEDYRFVKRPDISFRESEEETVFDSYETLFDLATRSTLLPELGLKFYSRETAEMYITDFSSRKWGVDEDGYTTSAIHAPRRKASGRRRTTTDFKG